jgi:hypothetical protein
LKGFRCGCRVDVLERFLLQIIWTNYLDQFQPYYGYGAEREEEDMNVLKRRTERVNMMA